MTGEAARAANAEAGLLGVAGFAKAAVLGAVLLEEGGKGGGEALPAAERDARDAKEGWGRQAPAERALRLGSSVHGRDCADGRRDARRAAHPARCGDGGRRLLRSWPAR